MASFRSIRQSREKAKKEGVKWTPDYQSGESDATRAATYGGSTYDNKLTAGVNQANLSDTAKTGQPDKGFLVRDQQGKITSASAGLQQYVGRTVSPSQARYLTYSQPEKRVVYRYETQQKYTVSGDEKAKEIVGKWRTQKNPTPESLTARASASARVTQGSRTETPSWVTKSAARTFQQRPDAVSVSINDPDTGIDYKFVPEYDKSSPYRTTDSFNTLQASTYEERVGKYSIGQDEKGWVKRNLGKVMGTITLQKEDWRSEAKIPLSKEEYDKPLFSFSYDSKKKNKIYEDDTYLSSKFGKFGKVTKTEQPKTVTTIQIGGKKESEFDKPSASWGNFGSVTESPQYGTTPGLRLDKKILLGGGVVVAGAVSGALNIVYDPVKTGVEAAPYIAGSALGGLVGNPVGGVVAAGAVKSAVQEGMGKPSDYRNIYTGLSTDPLGTSGELLGGYFVFKGISKVSPKFTFEKVEVGTKTGPELLYYGLGGEWMGKGTTLVGVRTKPIVEKSTTSRYGARYFGQTFEQVSYAESPMTVPNTRASIVWGGRPKLPLRGVGMTEYIPESAAATRLMVSNVKDIYPAGEILKIKYGTEVVGGTYKTKSRWISKKIIPETETLNEAGVRTSLGWMKDLGGQNYGSFAARQQWPSSDTAAKKNIAEPRTAMDLDMMFEKPSSSVVPEIPNLVKDLRKQGNVVRQSKANELLVESMVDGEWRHSLDIHTLDSAAQDMQSPGVAGEGAYGLPFNQGNIKVEGTNFMKLSEQGLRKGASTLTMREKGVGPEPHRGKDVKDFFATQEVLIASERNPFKRKRLTRSLEKMRELYPEEATRGGTPGNIPAGTNILPKLSQSSVSFSLASKGTKQPATFSSPKGLPRSTGPWVPKRGFSISALRRSMSPSKSKGGRSSSVIGSPSPSMSPSRSLSPSRSPSRSMSPSRSLSPSRSPSRSMSPSRSLSPSRSPSRSMSPSLSPSPSMSPSPSPSLITSPSKIIPPTYKIDKPKSPKKSKKSNTDLKGINLYNPSVEAFVFDVKGKPNLRLASTGLSLRPIRI